MPTGIPTPPFGLSETVLSVYGSATYYTHWIDNTHPSATDTSNPTGTPSTPRLTIPSLSSLAAGDVVQIRGGPYTGSAIAITGVGTASQPIFITGAAANTTEFRRAMAVVGTSAYIIVENLKFTTVDESVFTVAPQTSGQTCNRIVIRDTEFVGNGINTGTGACLAFGGSVAGVTVTECLALRNTIHAYGDWQAAVENDKHGMTAGPKANTCWYLNNHVYHCGGDAIQIGHEHNHESHTFYIGGNTFHNCGENAIDIKETHNLVISENECYGPFGVYPYIDDNQAIVLHTGATTNDGCYNVWVLNNYIHDCKHGVAHSNCRIDSPNWSIGNLIVDIEAYGIAHALSGTGYVNAYHNTLIRCGYGLLFTGAGSNTHNIGGNIVADATTGQLYLDTGPDGGTASNECYSGSTISIRWLSSTYASVAAWIAGSTAGDNSLETDPLFTNGASGDYTLQAGSPCIGAGLNMATVEDTFSAAFGTSLLKDRAGTTRPDGVWDIGAYQRPT